MTKPDYPWTGHGEPRNEYYTAVGFLCQQWNAVEWFYTHLASDIMRRKRVEHDLLFRHLGIVAVGEFMRDHAAVHIKRESTRDQLKHVTAYVNQCRINRNAIVHGLAAPRAENPDSMTVRSKADQRRAKESEFPVSLSDIARVCQEIELAGSLSIRLEFLFGRNGLKTAKNLLGEDWHARLHAKPALPELVTVNPQEPRKRQR